MAKKISKPASRAKSKTDSKKAVAKKADAKKSDAKKTAKSSPQDIVELILKDHKPLKKLIKVLKSDGEREDKTSAFEEFAPLLVRHAKPEEQSLYVSMKSDEDLRAEGFEGDTEHGIADQLVEEIKRTTDDDLWCARVKVLGELVEHHIEEEEEEMLPDFRKATDLEQRVELGQTYLRLRDEMDAEGDDDAPPERKVPARPRAENHARLAKTQE